MKRKILLITVLIIGTTFRLSGADDPPGFKNLLILDFAKLATTIGPADNPTGKLSVDPQVKRAGNSVLRFDFLQDREAARPRLAEIPVTPGGRYYFSCYVKFDSRISGTDIFMEALNAGKQGAGAPLTDNVHTFGNRVAYGSMLSIRAALIDGDPTKFNKVEWIFTVPENAAFVRPTLGLGWGKKTVWYDDFVLYALDADGEKTEGAQP